MKHNNKNFHENETKNLFYEEDNHTVKQSDLVLSAISFALGAFIAFAISGYFIFFRK